MTNILKVWLSAFCSLSALQAAARSLFSVDLSRTPTSLVGNLRSDDHSARCEAGAPYDDVVEIVLR